MISVPFEMTKKPLVFYIFTYESSFSTFPFQGLFWKRTFFSRLIIIIITRVPLFQISFFFILFFLNNAVIYATSSYSM